MASEAKVAVIGGGSFGTALVKIFSENDGYCLWWMHNEDSAAHIEKYHHNPRYLSSVRFNPLAIELSCSIEAVVAAADIIVLAVPSAFLKQVLAPLSPEAFEGKVVFSAIKGIVPDENMIVGEYLREVWHLPESHIGIISGPCHAEEIALERLSFLTVASQDPSIARQVAGKLENHYVRCTLSDDVFGAEYAAVIKNVYAIAAGMFHGLGYGDNFQAVLMSNAVREMKRFIGSVCDGSRNINKTAYVGDLLVTSYSQFSRNRLMGTLMGKGYTVKSVLAEMTMVAEGYHSLPLIYKLKKKREVRMPIVRAVHAVMYEGKSAKKTMAKLAQKLD